MNLRENQQDQQAVNLGSFLEEADVEEEKGKNTPFAMEVGKHCAAEREHCWGKQGFREKNKKAKHAFSQHQRRELGRRTRRLLRTPKADTQKAR